MSHSEYVVEKKTAVCEQHGEYVYGVIPGMAHLTNSECPSCFKAKVESDRLQREKKEQSERQANEHARRLHLSDFDVKFGVIYKSDAHCDTHGDYVSSVRIVNGKESASGCHDCHKAKAEAEFLEKMEADRKAAALHRVEKLLDQACIPPRFADKSFDSYRQETDKQKRIVAVCRDYAQNFPQKRTAGAGLILSGGKGTGKTHLTIAIGREVIQHHGCTFLFTTVSRLIRAVKSTFDKGSETTERDVYRQLSDVDLLALDEVGVQNGTDFERDVLFEVINRRYELMKPTILLSNLPPAEMEKVIGERAMDRMREGGKALAFSWDSYRGKDEQK